MIVGTTSRDLNRPGIISFLENRLASLPQRERRLAAATVGVVLIGWASMATFHAASGSAANDRAAAELRAKSAEIAAMRAEVAAMHTGVASLQATVNATAARIEARQQAISAVLGERPAKLVLASADVAAASDARLASGVGTLSLGAQALLAPLVHVETRQLALVAAATSAARARYQGATYTIRGLGLDPRRFTRATMVGMGGPLEPVDGDSADVQGQAKVQDLYQAWNRLGQLGQATAAIPSHMPVATAFNYTSGFGVRYDPFNGGAAMHAGVDMAGTMGEPIQSAAPGVVTRAGWIGGYGNCIEVDHGRGMATRYGHLSRILVRVGDRVTAGDEIGRMGSTGRSTGTHLHFEVRVDGRAVDPMPYLRAMPQIAAVQATAAATTAMGGPALPVAR